MTTVKNEVIYLSLYVTLEGDITTSSYQKYTIFLPFYLNQLGRLGNALGTVVVLFSRQSIHIHHLRIISRWDIDLVRRCHGTAERIGLWCLGPVGVVADYAIQRNHCSLDHAVKQRHSQRLGLDGGIGK